MSFLIQFCKERVTVLWCLWRSRGFHAWKCLFLSLSFLWKVLLDSNYCVVHMQWAGIDLKLCSKHNQISPTNCRPEPSGCRPEPSGADGSFWKHCNAIWSHIEPSKPLLSHSKAAWSLQKRSRDSPDAIWRKKVAFRSHPDPFTAIPRASGAYKSGLCPVQMPYGKKHVAIQTHFEPF